MDIWQLILGFFFSTVGMAFFIFGKKKQLWAPLFSGMALMIYPYFVSNSVLMVAIGVVLIIVPYFVRT